MVSLFNTSPLPPPEEPAADQPRTIRATHPPGDRVFRNLVRACGVFTLVITASVGGFLGYQMFPTLHRYGASFFTENFFDPETQRVGISSAFIGSIVIAVIALVIAFPIAFCSALYISDYAPPRLRALLTSLVDLMAAVPSIVYGLWGYFFLMPHARHVSRWIAQYFGWIPIFKVPGADPSSPTWPQERFQQSPFIAGLVVAMMVIPLATAIMRTVFGQAPLGEREAAYALGSTRWGMIRAVVIPYGRGGIVGGTMLGLGRALGETIAVLMILSISYNINVRILSDGAITISSLIANDAGEATAAQRSALLAAGFVLFLMTLLVNTVAAVIVGRGRSGSGVEI